MKLLHISMYLCTRATYLRREDIARSPADLGPECRERLNKHGRLRSNVRAGDNACVVQRLVSLRTLAKSHQARHLYLIEIEKMWWLLICVHKLEKKKMQEKHFCLFGIYR